MPAIPRLALTLALFAAAATAQVQYCTVAPAGESCGPQLVASILPQGNGGTHDLTLHATGLHVRAPAAMSWGSQSIAAVLPGGCPLLCDYLWGHYFQTDDLGEITWSRSWPGWAVGYFYMQFGSLDVQPNGAFSVKTTNCKRIECF